MGIKKRDGFHPENEQTETDMSLIEELIEHRHNINLWREELNKSLEKYEDVVMKILRRKDVEAKSKKITVTEGAKLLGCSRATMYKAGASQCKTYAELWTWVKENKPEKMKTLEENYEMAWQHKKSGAS